MKNNNDEFEKNLDKKFTNKDCIEYPSMDDFADIRVLNNNFKILNNSKMDIKNAEFIAKEESVQNINNKITYLAKEDSLNSIKSSLSTNSSNISNIKSEISNIKNISNSIQSTVNTINNKDSSVIKSLQRGQLQLKLDSSTAFNTNYDFFGKNFKVRRVAHNKSFASISGVLIYPYKEKNSNTIHYVSTDPQIRSFLEDTLEVVCYVPGLGTPSSGLYVNFFYEIIEFY